MTIVWFFFFANRASAMRQANKIPQILQALYELVGQLEAMHPERRFTLDGHLVGSIGEVLAAERYGLKLLPMSAVGHDARSPSSGTLVQVKATQRKAVGIRSEPEHLIVLKLQRDGTIDEIYNGPGEAPWRHAGKQQKNGQRMISTGKLRELMEAVPHEHRLPRVSNPSTR